MGYMIYVYSVQVLDFHFLNGILKKAKFLI